MNLDYVDAIIIWSKTDVAEGNLRTIPEEKKQNPCNRDVTFTSHPLNPRPR